MEKQAVDHHKAHKSPQWRLGASWPRVGILSSAFRRGRVGTLGPGGDAPGKCWLRAPDFPSLRESLNWSLRRYVLASSLRVWLRRQVPEAGGDGLFRVASRWTGTAKGTRSPGPAERANGVSLSSERVLRYRTYRNRQMEHLTQLAASLRGGVRRGTAITPRERTEVQDRVLTTLGDNSSV